MRYQCHGWASSQEPLAYRFGLSYDEGQEVQWTSYSATALYDFPCIKAGNMLLLVQVKDGADSEANLLLGPGNVGYVTGMKRVTCGGSATRRRRLSDVSGINWAKLNDLIISAVQRGQWGESALLVGAAGEQASLELSSGSISQKTSEQLTQSLIANIASAGAQALFDPTTTCQGLGIAKNLV
eukprot:757852-Hanusia_phi.AAC.1